MRHAPALTVILLVTVPLLAGCAGPSQGSAKGPQVLASFYPLAYMTQRIVGDKMSVGTIIPADAEPHDYELKPSDQSALDRARLIVFAGSGLELFFDKATRDAKAAGVPYVVASDGLEL